ncbi:hypothetical protein GCM10025779_31240 [Arthrobacter cryoconiti]
MTAGVQVSDNGVHAPVTILVQDVAAVSFGKQFQIPLFAFGKFSLPWTYANLMMEFLMRPVPLMVSGQFRGITGIVHRSTLAVGMLTPALNLEDW